MIELTLPLPPNVLHPNGRTRNVKWRASLVKKARSEAALVARMQAPAVPFKRAKVHATFYHPRERDDDGLIAWLKSYLDGLQDAGIIENDRGFTLLPPVQIMGKERKVVLRIEEA